MTCVERTAETPVCCLLFALLMIEINRSTADENGSSFALSLVVRDWKEVLVWGRMCRIHLIVPADAHTTPADAGYHPAALVPPPRLALNALTTCLNLTTHSECGMYDARRFSSVYLPLYIQQYRCCCLHHVSFSQANYSTHQLLRNTSFLCVSSTQQHDVPTDGLVCLGCVLFQHTYIHSPPPSLTHLSNSSLKTRSKCLPSPSKSLVRSSGRVSGSIQEALATPLLLLPHARQPRETPSPSSEGDDRTRFFRKSLLVLVLLVPLVLQSTAGILRQHGGLPTTMVFGRCVPSL